MMEVGIGIRPVSERSFTTRGNEEDAMSAIQVTFWGVRGSIPTPLTPIRTTRKIAEAIFALKGGVVPTGSVEEVEAWMKDSLPFNLRSTFGGNTTCVEVRCGDEIIILDMGTGIRELGKVLMPIIFKNHGLKVSVFLSHSHWDHIQGFPFFDPIYLTRELGVHIAFYGGTGWEAELANVLKGQMMAPYFPINLNQLMENGPFMEFNDIFDGKVVQLSDDIRVTCRLLDHPQRTFGFRIEHYRAVLAFCTDNEPRDREVPDMKLVRLAQDADFLIGDCQYYKREYLGEGAPFQRYGWGHSYPEALAAAARKAKVKRIVTFHHDPTHTDQQIAELAEITARESGIEAVAAYEGLVLTAG